MVAFKDVKSSIPPQVALWNDVGSSCNYIGHRVCIEFMQLEHFTGFHCRWLEKSLNQKHRKKILKYLWLIILKLLFFCVYYVWDFLELCTSHLINQYSCQITEVVSQIIQEHFWLMLFGHKADDKNSGKRHTDKKIK